ncbi:MAG: type IV pilus secretin PilQ [Thermodesulfobacteriota bacterium]
MPRPLTILLVVLLVALGLGSMPAAASDPPAPAATPQAAAAGPALPMPVTGLPETLISVRFIDADLGTVLRSLARMAGQNILVNPGVQGTVSTHIENTPWNEVFLGLVESYGLTLSREGSLLRVMSLDDLKQILERKALEREEKEQVAPLVTRIVGIEFANPDEIAESIRPLLTKDKEGAARGSVTVDVHSRSLVVQDVEENMAKLVAFVRDLDRSTPQILIEARIIETTMDTARELGVQWGWLHGSYGNLLTPGGINGTVDPATGRSTYLPGVDGKSRSGIGGQGFGVDLPAAPIGGINPASIGFINRSVSGNVLDVQLSALQEEGRVRILSRPSIATLDNNQAIVESGTDVPFQTVENDEVKVQYKSATLRLQVTPHVITDQVIKLNIEAKKDEVDMSRTVLGNPFIIRKLAQTQLLVENGATAVIAGLAKETSTDGNTGVPGLKDVPLLGWLFKKDSKSSDLEELLIFITPKILTGGAPADTAAAQPPEPAAAAP